MPDVSKIRNWSWDNRRQLDPDSDAYAQVGKKCVFCGREIRKVDVCRPYVVYVNSRGDKTAHGQCLDYIRVRYPDHAPEAHENTLIVTIKESGGVKVGL